MMDERESEVMDLLCAPEATDDLEDIDFDEDEAEEGFIRGWLREERAYNEKNRVTEESRQKEAPHGNS
jgi:hypothetical protein